MSTPATPESELRGPGPDKGGAPGPDASPARSDVPPPPTPGSTGHSAGPPAGLRFPESSLQVTAWADPVLDQLGHDPRSPYVERYWLSILGPSCLLLVRRMAAELEVAPTGFEMVPARWATELGLGMKGGRNGPFWKALERSCRFGAARRNGPRLAVRRRLPPLTARQIERLPENLRLSHDAWLSRRMDMPRRSTISRWPSGDDLSSSGRAPDAA